MEGGERMGRGTEGERVVRKGWRNRSEEKPRRKIEEGGKKKKYVDIERAREYRRKENGNEERERKIKRELQETDRYSCM